MYGDTTRDKDVASSGCVNDSTNDRRECCRSCVADSILASSIEIDWNAPTPLISTEKGRIYLNAIMVDRVLGEVTQCGRFKSLEC